jgi:hypothetical protein
MFDPSNSNRRFVLNQALPPPNFVPTEASWPPRSIVSNGSNARRAVDALTGRAKPLTVEAAFQRIESELTKSENLDLLNETLNLQERITTRLAEQKEARLAGLKMEWEAARAKARGWLEKCRSMRESLNSFESTLNALKMSASESRANFASVRESSPTPENYPTPEEIAAWQTAMGEAETVMVAEEERSRVAELDRQQRAANLIKALENFRIAEQSEALLRVRLEGQPYHNELGILIEEPEA